MSHIESRALVHATCEGELWPGPLRGSGEERVAGTSWGGCGALLRRLETALGLGGPETHELVRAARCVEVLRRHPGFWSRSLDVDPIAVALTVAGWIDELALCGWDGAATAEAPARLRDLASVNGAIPPGLPARIRAAMRALPADRRVLDEVTLTEPAARLPLLWRRLITALEQHGTRVVDLSATLVARDPPDPPDPTDPADPTDPTDPAGRSDLHRIAARPTEPIIPAGDGSLQLVRPHGPRQAAEDLAAWLAGRLDRRGHLDDVVVIGGEPVLDQALHRQGLPVLGCRPETAIAHPELQILPLSLALAWAPSEPGAMLELLALGCSPVPRSLRARLAGALAQWPGIGNATWNTALADGLAAIADEARRRRVRSRLDILLGVAPEIADDRIPAAAVLARVQAFAGWLGSMQSRQPAPDLRLAFEQVDILRATLAARTATGYSRLELETLVTTVTESIRPHPRGPRQAGLGHVTAPDAVLAPVSTIVWWGFHRDQAATPRGLPFGPREQQFLADRGVELPDPVVEAERQGDRWQRPLRMARDALVLVCPETGAAGHPAHPHPLWDEIRSRLVQGTEPALTTPRPASAQPLATEILAPLRQPTAPGTFAMRPGMIAPRDAESAHSLGRLASCGFRWLLHYQARIRAGELRALESGNLLSGKVLHHCLARALPAFDRAAGEATVDGVVARALRVFDAELPGLAGALAQPSAGPERARLRRILEQGTRDFVNLLWQSGLDVHLVETTVRRSVPEPWGVVSSCPDLVLAPAASGRTAAPVVIDFKFGGKHQDALDQGLAHQLATYAFLAQVADQPFPEAGYYILSRQRLATVSARFPGVDRTAAAVTLEDTWNALVGAARASWDALMRGAVAIPDPDTESAIDAGRLTLAPGCRFCDFGLLCGVDLPDPPAVEEAGA